MNREIKFRAWDKTFNKMIKVTDLNLDNRSLIGYAGERLVSCRFDDCELLQYTGLTDTKGIEIYEGDIVRCTRGCPHEVIYLQEYAGTYVGGMPAWYLSGIREGYAWTGCEEVIGNIYENPELLEETK